MVLVLKRVPRDTTGFFKLRFHVYIINFNFKTEYGLTEFLFFKPNVLRNFFFSKTKPAVCVENWEKYIFI